MPNARGKVKDSHEAQDQLVGDLALLGLRTEAGEYRSRGGHDLRATFISIAAEDGAVPDIIERGTHAPRRTVRAGYQRFTWPAICAEVAKLRVTLRAPSEVVELPVAAAVAGGGDPRATESASSVGGVESTGAPSATAPALHLVAADPASEPVARYRSCYRPTQASVMLPEKTKPPVAPCNRGLIAPRGRPSYSRSR